MGMAQENELERFKSDIHLDEFARERYGFEYDEERSTDRAKVLGDGQDKIVVARGDDGHWQYFNVHDQGDRGSVIDFVQNREGTNLGETRKLLRGVHGATPQPSDSISTESQVSTSEPDRDPVETVPDLDNVRNWAEWNHMEPAVDHPYLTEDREIDEGIIQDNRFPIAVFENENGIENVVYPHVNSEGVLAGYQEKNSDFERFAEGSTKALWRSRLPDPDEPVDNVIVTESVEDALAYEEANRPEGNVRYVAISGQPSDYGIEEAQKQIRKDNSAEVTFATDPDEQGKKYDKQIAQGIDQDRRDVYTHKPGSGRDWNDELKHQKEQSQDRGPRPGGRGGRGR